MQARRARFPRQLGIALCLAVLACACKEKGGSEEPGPSATGTIASAPPTDPSGVTVLENSNGTFEVVRDRAKAELEQLSPLQCPFVPVHEGEVVGVRLFGVEQGSLPYRFGLRSGDTIVRINGVDASNSSAMLAEFENLKSASNVTVDLLRGTKSTTLRYRIR